MCTFFSAEVVSDYFSEMALVGDGVDGPSALQDVVRERAQRQLAFMRRMQGKQVANSALRPVKRYRKAAYQWLIALENQVRSGGGRCLKGSLGSCPEPLGCRR